jgi:hypothetical protein
MNCPKCNKEMESGVIQAGGMIIWTPKAHKLSLLPREDGRDIVFDRNYITSPKAEARCCRDCGFAVLPIPEEGAT